MSLNLKISYYLLYFASSSIQFIISNENYDEQIVSLIGGTHSNPVATNNNNDEFPLAKYVVSLRGSDETYFGVSHFCGGSIIKPNVILTAAHCLFKDKAKRSASSIEVAAKTPMRLKKTANSELIRVEKIIIHQKYTPSKKMYDIALLILQHGIVLDNKMAAEIQLPKNVTKASSQCTVVGWGRLYMHGPLANELMYINVSVHHPRICKYFIEIFGVTQICASDFNDPEKSPCTGDSGGPLICDGVIAGIVSFGKPIAFNDVDDIMDWNIYTNMPTVYTDVYQFLDWIIQNSSQKLYSQEINNFVLTVVVVKFINNWLYL